MDKNNRLSFKLNQSANLNQSAPQRDDERDWLTQEVSYRSPSLPISYYQKRQRKKQRNWRHSSYFGRRGTGRFNRGRRLSASLKSSSKLILTILSAVGLGLLMGMMVLNIFSNLDKGTTADLAGDNHKQEASRLEEQETAAQVENPSLMPSKAVEGNTLNLPAKSYYVVQAGAFTDQGMADEGLALFQNKGWAGILLGEEAPYRLYAGVARSKEEAMLLGQFYREQQLDIYVKEHLIDSVSGVSLQLDTEELTNLVSFITTGEQLLEKMGRLSATGIMNPGMTMLDKEWQDLQDLHRSFLEEGQQLLATWSGNGQLAGERMFHQLSEGMNALEAYYKQKHTAYLWKVQQALLHYVQAYEQLVQSLN